MSLDPRLTAAPSPATADGVLEALRLLVAISGEDELAAVEATLDELGRDGALKAVRDARSHIQRVYEQHGAGQIG